MKISLFGREFSFGIDKNEGVLRGSVKKHTAKRSFEAGTVNRINNDFTSTLEPVAIDADIYRALKKTRQKARQLAQNNDWAKRSLQLSRDNTVGSQGFTLQLKPEVDGNGLDEQIQREVEAAFKEWSKQEFCTMSKKLTFKSVCELLVISWKRDGEFFVRIHRNRSVNKFGFSLELIEPDFIDETYNAVLQNGNVIRMGVEINDFREPVAYYIVPKNKTSELYVSVVTGQRTRIPAEEMIHFYEISRPDQTRGYPSMVQCMDTLRNLDGYNTAEITNARAGAAKMMMIETGTVDGAPVLPVSDSDNSEDGDNGYDSTGARLESIEPGIIHYLNPGEKVSDYDPKFPMEASEGFEKRILRRVSASNGHSYEALSGNLEGVNYSSIRQGVLEARETYKRDQAFFDDNFLKLIFTEWLKQSILVYTPFKKWGFEYFDKINRPTFIGRRWSWVDPLKDAMSNKINLDNGWTTNQKICSETGGTDYEENLRQLQKEKQLREKYGITSEVDRNNQELLNILDKTNA